MTLESLKRYTFDIEMISNNRYHKQHGKNY